MIKKMECDSSFSPLPDMQNPLLDMHQEMAAAVDVSGKMMKKCTSELAFAAASPAASLSAGLKAELVTVWGCGKMPLVAKEYLINECCDISSDIHAV